MNSFPNHKVDRGVRAVSPAIAHVLMAAAVISVGLGALFWARNTFGAHQSEAGIFFSRSSEAMKESFIIEDVWFYEDSGKYVNITVRNVGTVDLQITAIYMDDEKIWDETQSVEVREAVTIKVVFSWDSGEHYIVVATNKGNQVTNWYNTSG